MASLPHSFEVTSTQYDASSVWGWDRNSDNYSDGYFIVCEKNVDSTGMDEVLTTPFYPLISPDDIKSFHIYNYYRGDYQFLNGITWRQFAESQWNVIAGKVYGIDKLITIDDTNNYVIAGNDSVSGGVGTRTINNGETAINPDEVISSDGYYSTAPVGPV